MSFPDFYTTSSPAAGSYMVFRWHNEREYDEFLSDLAALADALEARGETRLANVVRNYSDKSFLKGVADSSGRGYSYALSTRAFDGRGENMLGVLAEAAIALAKADSQERGS